MALDAGTRLGPYEILSAIGAGGMGEVYLGVDTRLNRRVAIKVLPAQWASEPDMKLRFDREAQIVAGLSHPNICTLHDVGHQDGTDFLVMEYLEGQTLAARLEHGALSVDEALRIAIEIADALERAHHEGITHRDLKPGNVMLTTSGVKLLDFGLAKQQAPVKPSTGSASMLPTHADITMRGAIVGTLQYMAPEQLEGKEASPQTDIFAFGTVLYEMLTGRKAFASESQAGLISSIMTAAPPPLVTTLSGTSPALEYAVRKCLEKDPAKRWQAARDLLDHLRWVQHGGGPAVPAATPAAPSRRPLVPVVAVLATLVLAATALALVLSVRQPPPADEIRFTVDGDVVGAGFAVSPNGRWIAFAANKPGGQGRALFLRSMGSITPVELPGTEGAIAPFWSPGSDRIGFFDDTSLKTVAVSGGSPQVVCAAQGPNRSGTWNSDDVIVFTNTLVLNRVSASGGSPEAITSLNLSRAETVHAFPHFLPGGQRFLFVAGSQQVADQAIYAGTLGSTDTTRLLAVNSSVSYSASGHLLYFRDGALVAHPFDVDALALTGEPVRVADRVGAFSISNNGTLVFRAPPSSRVQVSQFSWVDRGGKLLTTVGEPSTYVPYMDLSPDGKQAAVTRIDQDTRNLDLWTVDLERGIASRLTSDPSPQADPNWSPDGLRIAFTTQQTGNRDVFERKATGLGNDTAVLDSPAPESIDDWSPDGTHIVYRTGANTNTIYALPLTGDRKPFPVIESEFNKDGAHVSPDGRWLAYNSLESGTWQVYVVSFPKPDQKRQISTGGGVQARWSREGKQLYYLGLDGKLMAADMTLGQTLGSGTPRLLFETGIGVIPDADQYAVGGDDQRFLLLKVLAVQPPAPASAGGPRATLTAIVNWTAALRGE